MIACRCLYSHPSAIIKIAIAFACALFWAMPYAYAQSATATLSGTVEDENGSMIPGVEVIVLNPSTMQERRAATNNDGYFAFTSLQPASYTIKAKREGFAPAEIKDVVLNVNDQRSLRVQLRVGAVGEVVNIEGASLANTDAAVGTVVDRRFVENLPLNGRSFQSLIALTPGVVVTKSTFSEQGQFSVNGQRANANYFVVDGVSANAGVSSGVSLVQSAGGALPAFSAAGGTNSLVSVDAMQEFEIQTSTFAPEFGRTPGGQVSIITRSGTNDFRGALFEYFRNDALDANDWFANSSRLTKPALRQNDFGGVLGGPLIKNQTFFFFSYEGLRLRLPIATVTLVPSVASRQSALPQRRPFLDAYPIPNGRIFTDETAEFNASYSDPLNLNTTSGRIDHILSKKLALFGRYNYSSSDTTQRGTFSRSLNTLTNVRSNTQTLTIGVTQTLTTTVSNEIRANYTKSEGANFLRTDDFGGAVSPPESLFFPSFTDPQKSLFFFSIFGVGDWVRGKNAENTQRQINLVDNLSVITGNHQLKFGIDYRLLLPISGPRAYAQSVNFAGVTGAMGAISGNARSVRVNASDTVPLGFTNVSVYAQDTWKSRSGLTLTYGLRWDVNPAPKGRNGKDLFTFENVDNPDALRLAPRGTPLYETTYSNFAPRIGLAYQLSSTPGKETVLRGGFGVFYDLGSGSLGGAGAAFPYTTTKILENVPFPLTQEQAAPLPFTLDITASGGAFVADRNLRLPRTYQWNIALEQSFSANQTLTTTYAAAVGRRLLRAENIITPSGFYLNLTRNTATSDYHALQLQFQRRLSRGVQALASYTWAHSIDTASSDSFPAGGPNYSKINRASSDFDVRHSFNAAVTYDLPAPALDRAARLILRDWSIDTILTARSATPVDIIAGSIFLGGVQTFTRPDLVQGEPLYLSDRNVGGGRRFNPAAFLAPPIGRQGTLGRNVLRGFPMWQVDLALRRQISLTERVKLQLRSEFFNLFNHPNFGDPGNFQGNSLLSPLFGQSTSMLGRSLGSGGLTGGFSPLYQIGGPRSIQLALKLTF
jgi:Carboxypeptidase regulatory-like domain/TonB-dependent Receptor Plug Domain